MNQQALSIIIRRGIQQGLNPEAIAKRIVEASEPAQPEHLCIDCWRPMQVDMQEQVNRPPLTIVTCKHKDCTLWSVTLATDVYENLTQEQLNDYRVMVAKLKKQFEK